MLAFNKIKAMSEMPENVNELPKSLKRIVKFYRFFGFSFLGFNLDKKRKTCCNYISIVLNIILLLLTILDLIVDNLIRNYLEEEIALKSKPVLKTIIRMGNMIINLDVIVSYCFSLRSGSNFIKLLDNEDTASVDNNVKIANKIIGSFHLLALFLIVIIIGFMALNPDFRRSTFSNAGIGSVLIISYIIAATTILNISWFMSVIFVYITIIIRKQIKLLDYSVSHGKYSDFILLFQMFF